MQSGIRSAVALGALLAAFSAAGESPAVIAGGIYEDASALAVHAGFTPAAGVTVRLYRDGGDRNPTPDDRLLSTTTTNAAGVYVFRAERDVYYWVAVDSRTFGTSDAWAEQTFGPPGSLCAHPAGPSRVIPFEGPCFGGRTQAPDAAAALTTSEHLALVTLNESATRIDFAFSYNVVTSVLDGDRQGTLRQFLTNANALPGPNRMRFVPVEPSLQQPDTPYGTPARWWGISVEKALPELRDDDTTIDGTAFSFVSPASVVDLHPGRIGERPTFRPNEARVPRLEKPELELRMSSPVGIVCSARCGLRGVAIHGQDVAVAARADARIEHVLIGASPDGTPSHGGIVGLQVEKGVTYARDLLVTGQERAGVIVAPGARIDGERLDVSDCGDPQTGGGIVLASDGSSIRSSMIAANQGAGVIIGLPDGSSPAHENTIDGSVISGNQGGVILGPGSSRNTISRNDIMWNRLGGITATPFEDAPPLENRFSANRFDENGLRPIVLDLASETPNELAPAGESCEPVRTAANRGIPTPRLTSVEVIEDETSARVVIRGTACKGAVVELYQSFVTSVVRDGSVEWPRIRSDRESRESISEQERTRELPSIGEFNYLGPANTADDGTFEATFPLQITVSLSQERPVGEKTNVWADDALFAARPSDRAFAAIAIDEKGNSSEMGVRRRPDDRDGVKNRERNPAKKNQRR